MTRYPHPVFGWKHYRLSDLPMQALHELREAVENDPANRSTDCGIYLFKPDARRKLDALARAIADKMKAEAPLSEGEAA